METHKRRKKLRKEIEEGKDYGRKLAGEREEKERREEGKVLIKCCVRKEVKRERER